MFENINQIKQKHLEFFINILQRPEMFIGEYSDEKFMIYIYGFKLGSETGFIDRFSNYITEKHAVKFKSQGLKQQIETLAKKRKHRLDYLFCKRMLCIDF